MTSVHRAIIRAARVGIVPEVGADALTIGCEAPLQILSAVLAGLPTRGHPPAILVRGEWGTGKTHLLWAMRAAAGVAGFATACASVDARGTPLNYPQRVFLPLVQSLRMSSLPIGLRAIASTWMTDPMARARLGDYLRRSQNEWSRCLLSLVERAGNEDSYPAPDDLAWKVVLGADLVEYGGPSNRHKCLARIVELSGVLRAMGATALFVTVDEVETVEQLSSIVARVGAYETVGCLMETHGIVTALGVTDRLVRLVRSDAEMHAPRWTAESHVGHAVTRIAAGRVTTIQPTQFGRAEGTRLAARVASVYAEAYPGCRVTEEALDAAVRDWMESSRRDPRRLLRLIVADLDRLRPV